MANPPAHPARATRLFVKVLDDLVPVPGTSLRIGLDPVLSLVPWAGTAVGAGFGAVILIDAMRLRAPLSVLLRMGSNLLLDWLLGLIPFIGAVFDFTFRSNRRNLALLNRTTQDRELVRRASIRYWLAAAALLVLILATVVAIPIALLLGLDALIRSAG